MATMTLVKPVEATLNLLKSAFIAKRENEELGVYPESVESIRDREYPLMQGTTYLDHTGTTLYAKSLIESFSAELTNNLFGNPHSASTSSQLSTIHIEATRLAVLKFVNADPNDFDVVFVANTTAAIKLVADAFRDQDEEFWYGYHRDSHNSLVGVRELTKRGGTPFCDDEEVEEWMNDPCSQSFDDTDIALFAYPGQSNMTGRCLPYNWCQRIRDAFTDTHHKVYTLYDAAAIASTSPLDLCDSNCAPDFTVLSFYKIFGFPDLGALIVRKCSSDILRRRRYFGGGTVDMVAACNGEPWHARKPSLHDSLEDGTLPFHNIIALDHAIKVHARLYGSMANISKHVAALRSKLHTSMLNLKHENGRPVCHLYSQGSTTSARYGPIIAFNLLDAQGDYISNYEVEKLAAVKSIQVRTGGFCNPGGVAKHLDLSTEELKLQHEAGRRCGDENDIINGKPFGAIRVSIGAMSSRDDVENFVRFLEEFYVTKSSQCAAPISDTPATQCRFWIESMSVFPIKSCSAFRIPANTNWEVSAKGLAWDREWCLVHQGTSVALSQNRYPQMALIQPSIDTRSRTMTVSFEDSLKKRSITIPLEDYPQAVASLQTCERFKQGESIVCGENIPVHVYTLPQINDFFTQALGVPCSLARYFNSETNVRYVHVRKPKSMSPKFGEVISKPLAIKLSNESPILLVSRSSVNRLNEQIRQYRSHPEAIAPEAFRANIIVTERKDAKADEAPYEEDLWKHVTIGSGRSSTLFDVLGPCKRCQMVCVDQNSAERRAEPFSTLAKTRRWDGGVWFGMHLCLREDGTESSIATLRVGDSILTS